ncbi:MAG: cation transporter [Bacteroidota bacterium]|nr:cation transporter [Bacteroidota bacterium]
MKKITTVFALIITMIVATNSNTLQAQESGFSEVKIKTSAVCDMCKETLEKAMAFEKGVKRSSLDVDSKILTVTYNPKKTTVEKIRLAVTKAGYDADEIPANNKAYDKLDACCKKGAVCNDKK